MKKKKRTHKRGKTKTSKSSKEIATKASKTSDHGDGAVPKTKVDSDRRDGAVPKKNNGTVPSGVLKKIALEHELTEDQKTTLKEALLVGLRNVFLKTTVGSKRALGKAVVELQELLNDGAKSVIEKVWLRQRKMSYDDAYRKYFKIAIRLHEKAQWVPKDTWVDTAVELVRHDEYLKENDPVKHHEFRNEIIDKGTFNGLAIRQSKDLRDALLAAREDDAGDDNDSNSEKRQKKWNRLESKVTSVLREVDKSYQKALTPTQKAADKGKRDGPLAVEIGKAVDACEKLAAACAAIIKQATNLARKLDGSKKSKADVK